MAQPLYLLLNEGYKKGVCLPLRRTHLEKSQFCFWQQKADFHQLIVN